MWRKQDLIDEDAQAYDVGIWVVAWRLAGDDDGELAEGRHHDGGRRNERAGAMAEDLEHDEGLWGAGEGAEGVDGAGAVERDAIDGVEEVAVVEEACRGGVVSEIGRGTQGLLCNGWLQE